MAGNEPEYGHCGEVGCSEVAVGIWAWKAIDMTVGVPYCAVHSVSIKKKVETAGRMAGGTTLADMKN